MIALLLACAGSPGDSGAVDTHEEGVTDYVVSWSASPSLTAGVESEFSITVTDQAGRPIEDLQTNHERVIHTIFVSADLETFIHRHHEDYADLTVDDIRAATFHFPVTFPTSGAHLAMFDYAHQNQWLKSTDTVEVSGVPAQAAAYNPDFSTERDLGDVRVSLTWGASPVAGYEASLSVNITEADGTAVTDLTQYLGADGHMALVSADLAISSHTHAWFPGMGDMSPTMEMPHLYSGPDLPFAFTFPTAGVYKLWIQFTRESADTVYVAPFLIEVAG